MRACASWSSGGRTSAPLHLWQGIQPHSMSQKPRRYALLSMFRGS